MDKQTFRVLEYERIMEMASCYAVTSPGASVVADISPLGDIAHIRERIDLVSEARRYLAGGQRPGIEHFGDLVLLFQKLRPRDAVLIPADIRSFLPLLTSSENLRVFGSYNEYTLLRDLVSALQVPRSLRENIESAVDTDGTLKDTASNELYQVRQRIKGTESKIQGILQGLLGQSDLEPFLQDTFITQRNNRWVIPVKQDAKGRVQGVIHDISNTGETVFIEPYVVQQAANELESLRAEEKLEEFRILKRLSYNLREHITEMESDYRIIIGMDLIFAVSGFSEAMNMTPPEINEKGFLRITGGRHPLLWKAFISGGSDNEIIPVDIELGRDCKSMVITGSNAGGKTVTLKTAGVLTLMALSGLHTPSDSGTSIPYLEHVFADIGDEQSIDNSLSTFSAHITRISAIVSQSRERSLIILDELGTGTDPEQGGALSCAVLRRLVNSGALSLVSTHLGMVKAFAHTQPGMMNSAMQMREEVVDGVIRHVPTYRLKTGEPGTSHAFEIAETLGLPAEIVREARELAKDSGAVAETLISELRQKGIEADKRLIEAEKLRHEAELMKQGLKKELEDMRRRKQEALAEGLESAEEIIRSAKAEAHDILRDIKKSTAAEARELAKKIDFSHKELKDRLQKSRPAEFEVLDSVNAGQRVFMRSLGINGVITYVDQKSGKCRVMASGKEITLPVEALSSAQGAGIVEKPGTRSPLRHDLDQTVHLDKELNIVGSRVDPAMSRIERYLNDASLAGITEVIIIHGIGTGVLARAVREFLQGHPLVSNFREGIGREGGGGVTVVSL